MHLGSYNYFYKDYVCCYSGLNTTTGSISRDRQGNLPVLDYLLLHHIVHQHTNSLYNSSVPNYRDHCSPYTSTPRSTMSDNKTNKDYYYKHIYLYMLYMSPYTSPNYFGYICSHDLNLDLNLLFGVVVIFSIQWCRDKRKLCRGKLVFIPQKSYFI